MPLPPCFQVIAVFGFIRYVEFRSSEAAPAAGLAAGASLGAATERERIRQLLEEAEHGLWNLMGFRAAGELVFLDLAHSLRRVHSHRENSEPVRLRAFCRYAMERNDEFAGAVVYRGAVRALCHFLFIVNESVFALQKNVQEFHWLIELNCRSIGLLRFRRCVSCQHANGHHQCGEHGCCKKYSLHDWFLLICSLKPRLLRAAFAPATA